MIRQQRGMTLVSVILIAGLVGLVGYGALRLVPVYLTQMKIRSLLNELKVEFDGQQPTLSSINSAIGKRLDIDMIDFPTRKDFVIRKTDAGFEVGVAYEDRVPYIANLYLAAEFDNVVEIRR